MILLGLLWTSFLVLRHRPRLQGQHSHRPRPRSDRWARLSADASLAAALVLLFRGVRLRAGSHPHRCESCCPAHLTGVLAIGPYPRAHHRLIGYLDHTPAGYPGLNVATGLAGQTARRPVLPRRSRSRRPGTHSKPKSAAKHAPAAPTLSRVAHAFRQRQPRSRSATRGGHSWQIAGCGEAGLRTLPTPNAHSRAVGRWNRRRTNNRPILVPRTSANALVNPGNVLLKFTVANQYSWRCA